MLRKTVDRRISESTSRRLYQRTARMKGLTRKPTLNEEKYQLKGLDFRGKRIDRLSHFQRRLETVQGGNQV